MNVALRRGRDAFSKSHQPSAAAAATSQILRRLIAD
jgi:hypothetical protein